MPIENYLKMNSTCCGTLRGNRFFPRVSTYTYVYTNASKVGVHPSAQMICGNIMPRIQNTGPEGKYIKYINYTVSTKTTFIKDNFLQRRQSFFNEDNHRRKKRKARANKHGLKVARPEVEIRAE